MKILLFSNIPAPYFIEYLKELSKYASIHAVFERKMADDRDKSWEFFNSDGLKVSFMKGIKTGSEAAFSFEIIKFIKQSKDSIIVFANPTTPSGILGIMYCKFHKIKYVLQSEGGLHKDGKGLKEKFKRKLLSGASLYLSGMKGEDDYFSFYGAPVDKIVSYNFASLHSFDFLNSQISDNDKKEIRRQLGIHHNKVILYVGRMIKCKGIDVLLNAIKGIDKDTLLLLVGGESNKEYDMIINENNLQNNVNFIKHINLDLLKKYYLSADIFVLPTRGDTWGLVINEAMTYGLPVLTTKSCVAGVQLIEDEINGFLFEAEDCERLHDLIFAMLEDKELRLTMGLNNMKKISNYSYEIMAKQIFEGIKRLKI